MANTICLRFTTDIILTFESILDLIYKVFYLIFQISCIPGAQVDRAGASWQRLVKLRYPTDPPTGWEITKASSLTGHPTPESGVQLF